VSSWSIDSNDLSSPASDRIQLMPASLFSWKTSPLPLCPRNTLQHRVATHKGRKCAKSYCALCLEESSRGASTVLIQPVSILMAYKGPNKSPTPGRPHV